MLGRIHFTESFRLAATATDPTENFTMSTSSLSAVSLETINLYASAAKSIVGAYRTGTTRALQGLEGRLAGGLNSESLRISAALKSSLLAVEQQIASLVHGGVEAVATAYTRAIDTAATAATTGVSSVAAAGAQLKNSLPGNTAEALITLQIPGAQLSRDLAERVAEAAQQVVDRVATGTLVDAATGRTVPTTSKRASASAKS